MIFHKQMYYLTAPSEAQNYLCMPLVNTTQANNAPEASTASGLWPQHEATSF